MLVTTKPFAASVPYAVELRCPNPALPPDDAENLWSVRVIVGTGGAQEERAYGEAPGYVIRGELKRFLVTPKARVPSVETWARVEFSLASAVARGTLVVEARSTSLLGCPVDPRKGQLAQVPEGIVVFRQWTECSLNSTEGVAVDFRELEAGVACAPASQHRERDKEHYF